MGYTHYFTQTRNLTQTEWDKLAIATQDIIDESGVAIVAWDGEPNSLPVINDSKILFNGCDDDAHETMALSRIDDGFAFCKTARKDYDIVVTAVLSAAEFIAPGAWEIGSDGNESDWVAGVELASKVVNKRVAKVIEKNVFSIWRGDHSDFKVA